MHKVWSANGVWRWESLEPELPKLHIFLNEKSFLFLNFVRVLSGISAMLYPGPIAVATLLFIHVLTVVRWLGSFNGGSDYMNSLLLLFTLIGCCFLSSWGPFAFGTSLFNLFCPMAKQVGLKSRIQNGERAKPWFICRFSYLRESPAIEPNFARREFALPMSWAIILFELSFPLAVLDQRIAAVFMVIAIGFTWAMHTSLA